MQAAADAGIEDIVYFFYPNIPAPTLLGGTSPNTLLDWTYPQVEQLCNDTELETSGRLAHTSVSTTAPATPRANGARKPALRAVRSA